MNAKAAALLDFARRNRLHIGRIAVIATIHAVLLGLAYYVTLNHNLENTIGQLFTFGLASPAKETLLTQTSAIATSILSQPFAVVSDHLPDVTDVPNFVAEVIGWTLLALNSLLWGIAIYVSTFSLRRRKIASWGTAVLLFLSAMTAPAQAPANEPAVYDFHFVDTPIDQVLDEYRDLTQSNLKIKVPKTMVNKTIVMSTEPNHKLTRTQAIKLMEDSLRTQLGVVMQHENGNEITVTYDPTIITHKPPQEEPPPEVAPEEERKRKQGYSELLRNAQQSIPVAQQFRGVVKRRVADPLFAELSYDYDAPDRAELSLRGYLHKRYSLGMTVPVTVSPDRRSVVGHGEPKVSILEIESIERNPRATVGGPVVGWGMRFTTNQLTFGLPGWKRLMNAHGDFSAIGYAVKTNAPVAHFNECLNNEIRGEKMLESINSR